MSKNNLKRVGEDYNHTKKFRVWNDGCNRYWCLYNKEELGYIEYWKPWKKFVWNQNKEIIMSESCLKWVIEIIKILEECVKE